MAGWPHGHLKCMLISSVASPFRSAVIALGNAPGDYVCPFCGGRFDGGHSMEEWLQEMHWLLAVA